MGGCAANGKLAVDLLHKSNELIIGAESGSSVCAHAGNSRCRVKVGSSGALGRGHDFGLQLIHAAAVIHKERQAGGGAGHLVREADELIEPGTGGQCGHQGLDLAQHTICQGATGAEASVEVFLLLCGSAVAVRHLLDFGICSHKLGACLCNLGGINSSARGTLDLLKGVERSVKCGGYPLEHGAHPVIEDHLRSDSCHSFTTLGKAPALYRSGRELYLRFALFLSSASFFRSAAQRASIEAMTKARSLTGRLKNLDGSQPNFCRQKCA